MVLPKRWLHGPLLMSQSLQVLAVNAIGPIVNNKKAVPVNFLNIVIVLVAMDGIWGGGGGRGGEGGL